MPIELTASKGPSVDVAVVLQADLDLVGQARLGDPLLGQLGLAPGDRDADRLDPVVLGGVQHHAAPAAAHVEQAHARLQAQLAADQLVLVGLRLLQRVGRVVEHRARVGQAGPEHEPVEGVGDVVVVADRRRVAGLAVAPPVQADLLGRRRQAADLRGPAQLAHQVADDVGRRASRRACGRAAASRSQMLPSRSRSPAT